MIPLTITLLATFGFLIAGTVSLRRGLFLMLALFPFLPYYFAIPVGGSTGGAGIAAARLFGFVLFMLLMLSLLYNPKGWQGSLRAIAAQRWIVWAFVVLTLSRMLSTGLNQPPSALVYWFDETIMLSTVFLLSVRVFLDLSNIERLGRIFLLVALAQIALVVIESGLDRHLLAGAINIQVSTVGTEVLEGRIRGGAHRAQALFDNPLSLAEYLLYASIVIFFLYRMTEPRRLLGVAAVIALLAVAVLQTKARFPFVLVTATGVLYYTLSLSTRVSALTKVVVVSMLLLAAGTFSAVAGYVVFNLDRLLPILDLLYADEDDISKKASIISRVSQYSAIPLQITSQGFGGLLGEGYRSNILERLDIKLDNYYLRLMIEGGLLAMVSFMSILLLLVAHSFKAAQQARALPLEDLERAFVQRINLFFTFFFLQFAFSKLFLSMNFNNYLLFVMAGAFFAVSFRVKERRLHIASMGDLTPGSDTGAGTAPGHGVWGSDAIKTPGLPDAFHRMTYDIA